MALAIMGIDQWVQGRNDSDITVKYCAISCKQRSGLLAVSPADIDAKTRVILQKLLQALAIKTSKQYVLDAKHDCIWIMGTSLASSLTGVDQDYLQWQSQTVLLPRQSTRIIVTPSLTSMQDDMSLKKLVWKTLSSYFLQST